VLNELRASVPSGTNLTSFLQTHELAFVSYCESAPFFLAHSFPWRISLPFQGPSATPIPLRRYAL